MDEAIVGALDSSAVWSSGFPVLSCFSQDLRWILPPEIIRRRETSRVTGRLGESIFGSIVEVGRFNAYSTLW